MDNETTQKATMNWKRPVTYVIAVFVLALGVFLNVKSGLGCSTTNSVPNVIAVAGQMNGLDWLTLGNACSIVYIVDMLFQCIVYRKIKLKVLLQFPFALVFGRIVDLYGMILMSITGGAEIPLGIRVVLFACSIIFTAIGCAVVVNMDYVPNPPDGGVQALAKLTNLPFGRAKWLWDGILLVVTTVISMFIGVPVIASNNIFIGTIIAFFSIGNIIFWFNHKFDHVMKAINPSFHE